MKNSMKKLLCMILAIMMVACLAACGEEKKEETTETPAANVTEVATADATTEEPAEEPEEEPEEEPVASDDELIADAVKNYVDGLFDLDSSAKDYAVDGSGAAKMAETMTKDELLAVMSEGIEESGIPEDVAKDMMDVVADELIEVLDKAEVKDVKAKVDGDKATATVTMSVPDFENVSFDDFGGEEKLMEMITPEEMADIEEKAKSAKSEEEAMELVMGIMVEKLPALFADLMKDVPSIEKTAEFTMEKADGKWLVSNSGDEVLPDVEGIF